MRARAALLAVCAALAWIANWSVHASMALARPLALPGAICGSPPAPDAPCPVCEEALAATAGPAPIPALPCKVATVEVPGLSLQPGAFNDVFLDGPARAPPRA